VSFIPHLCTIRAHRKETVRSRLQVVHSGSERRQKINLLSVVGGKMGVTLYRPASFLHAWHDFETESRVRRGAISTIADFCSRSARLRLGRHGVHVVSPRPPGVPGSITLIVEFACEDVRDARLSGRSASRASMSAIPRNLPGNTGFPPAAAGGNGITFRLRGPPHW
jgi:hypothetical protein